MLLDRESEAARIEDLLHQARRGRSGVLVLRGEAGIGKSTLLEHAVELAEGMQVLRAQAFESESEIAFAGLADLLGPVLHRLPALPPPQAEALSGALAIGPAVRADRFTICAATLSLLAAAAEDRPVLAIVDDAHWLDISSMEALQFAARRLRAEGVVMLIAARPSTSSHPEFADLPEVALKGLSKSAALTLAATSGDHLSTAQLDQLYTATEGNPLALLEITPLLAQVEATGELWPGAPLPPGVQIERALRRQLQLLPGTTRAALLVVAASDSGDLPVVTSALEHLGMAMADLAPAEASGTVLVDGLRVRFRHPLLRSVLYHEAPVSERLSAHRALADALGTTAFGQASDLRAWHLGHATLSLDEEAAHALEGAGTRACHRGGYATAASALERAARLTPAGMLRARRLLKAAKWWQLAGRVQRAGRLLEEALRDTDDPVQRAEIQHLRGFVQMWRQAPPTAQQLLRREAERVVDADPGRAALMYADAAVPCYMTGDLAGAQASAREAHRLGRRVGGTARLVATVLLAVTVATDGRPGEAAALLEEVDEGLASANPLLRAQELLFAAMTWVWLERYDKAAALVDHVVSSARAASALGVLPYALAIESELGYRTGQWATAYASATESVHLADETRQANSYGLYYAARAEAAMGLEDSCREHARRALEAADQYGIGCMPTYAGSALGLLELGLGRPEMAITALERVRDLAAEQELRLPTVIPWSPDLIEAYVRARRPADAQRELDALVAVAGDDDLEWVGGAIARCRGLLADHSDMDEHFRTSLSRFSRTPAPFDRARTLLCWGERLRRARQRVEARSPLREALEVFEGLGARPWADRASTELLATGETARPRDGQIQRLTPQELQVALAVGTGVTNAQAAANLFLSRKTIEFHLSSVYRKTGVTHRGELERWLNAHSVA